MAEMYARRVIRGVMTIDEVPELWRDAAREIVERETGAQEG